MNFNYKIRLFSDLGKYLVSGETKLQVNQIVQGKM